MDSLYVRTYETEEVMALIEKMEGLNENSNSKVHFPWKDVIASIRNVASVMWYSWISGNLSTLH